MVAIFNNKFHYPSLYLVKKISQTIIPPKKISPQKSHHVLAPQRDGESRVFAYEIGKYGRRSRGV